MAFLQCESAVLQFVSFNSLPLKLKTVLYHKTCTTLSALKWLFSSVSPVLLHKTAVFSKVLSHWVQLNCFSPMWFQSCNIKPCTTLSALKWLFCSVSPVLWPKNRGIFKGFYHTECTLTAFLSCDFSHVTSKLVPHWVHSNGFSPV